MTETTWSWAVLETHGPALFNGAVVTLVLAGAAIALGTALGSGLGILTHARHAAIRPLAWLVSAGLRAIRLLPILVILLLLLHASPVGAEGTAGRLGGIFEGWADQAGQAEAAVLRAIATPAFLVALAALTLHLAASVADVVRRSIASVHPDLIEVGRAQGMTRWGRLRWIIVPETFRRAFPAVLNLALTTFLLTTLAAVIGCSDLLGTAWTLSAETGAYTEMLSVVALFFLVIAVPAHLLIRRLEHSAWLRRRV